MFVRMQEMAPLLHCWQACKTMHTPWERAWQLLTLSARASLWAQLRHLWAFTLEK